MRRIITTLFIAIICVMSVYSQSDKAIHLKGSALDKNGTFIPFVNVLILNKKSGIAADYFGHFSLLVEKNDSLLITAVGYKNYRFIIPDTITSQDYRLSVILETDTILLKRAVVYPWPATAKLLKMEYLELELPDDYIDFRLPKHYGYISRTSEGYIGFTMQGPISFLYDKFSRAAKSRRLYESLIRKDKEDKYIASRFNKDLIERITGLTGREEIETFMEFCDLSYDYILGSTDYEIYLSVTQYYSRYLTLVKSMQSVLESR